MYKTDACRSGLIAFLLMLPIVLPMKCELLRTKVRKAAKLQDACLIHNANPWGRVCFGKSRVRFIESGSTHDTSRVDIPGVFSYDEPCIP